MFNVVPYVYVNSFANTDASVRYLPLFNVGAVQFTMLQTGRGYQTLVGRHVVSSDFGIYPALQVNERDSLALYIRFAVFENRPLPTVGELHASETCYIFKEPNVLSSEIGVMIDYCYIFSNLYTYIPIKTY